MTAPAVGGRTESAFLVEDFEPAYVASLRGNDLFRRAQTARRELGACRMCPRCCEVDRLNDEKGVCLTGRYALVASVFPHFGEEECLRGDRGSGTIFFGGCNLRCVFCQNWEISQGAAGIAMTETEIAEAMLALQDQGCHNVNLVTPEHVVPQIVGAIAVAAERGLRVPIVYNTSGYDALSSLELLDGLVDVYMPDFKFWSSATSERYVRARDYPRRARAAILAMHRQVGDLRLGSDGVARRGLLVRHLLMPGRLDESAAIFGWLATELSRDTYLNIMAQYRPAFRVGEASREGARSFPEIGRPVEESEIDAARDAAREAGLWRFA
jgi:putative pyruvate formate lyase activating enzyme